MPHVCLLVEVIRCWLTMSVQWITIEWMGLMKIEWKWQMGAEVKRRKWNGGSETAEVKRRKCCLISAARKTGNDERCQFDDDDDDDDDDDAADADSHRSDGVHRHRRVARAAPVDPVASAASALGRFRFRFFDVDDAHDAYDAGPSSARAPQGQVKGQLPLPLPSPAPHRILNNDQISHEIPLDVQGSSKNPLKNPQDPQQWSRILWDPTRRPRIPKEFFLKNPIGSSAMASESHEIPWDPKEP